MAKKKKPAKQSSRSKPKKPAPKQPAKKRIASPKKKLDQVRKSIRQTKQPVYNLNRRIANAPTTSKQRKLKKERKDLLASIDKKLSGLNKQRASLRGKVKVFNEKKEQRARSVRRAWSLEAKIKKAADKKDLKTLEKLRYQLLKELGEISRHEKELKGMSGEVFPEEIPTVFPTEPEEEEDEEPQVGPEYIEDPNNPYAVWEAIRQLNTDLSSGEWKYIIINGKRFSTANEDEILAESSLFWLIVKKGSSKDDTPRVNRYMNMETKTIRYVDENF